MSKYQYIAAPSDAEQFESLDEFLSSGKLIGILNDGFTSHWQVSDRSERSCFIVFGGKCKLVSPCPACRQFCIFEPFNFLPVRRDHRHVVLPFLCRNCRDGKRLYHIEFDEIAPPKGQDDSRLLVKLLWSSPSALEDQPDETRPHLKGELLAYYTAGRRSEADRLGLGAFTYYRRVVEGLKDEIFDKMIKVAEQEETHAELIDQLKKAKEHRQFEASFKEIKGALPRRLLIDDMSPISLLNTSLSNGIHAHSDADCLEVAQDVRLVLGHLLKRLDELLRADDGHVRAAVKRLHTRNLESKKRPAGAVE